MEREDKSSTPSTLFGIERFVSCHPGFSGVVKQEFSDFVVNEIDINGQIVKIDGTYDIPVNASSTSAKQFKSCGGTVQIARQSGHSGSIDSEEQNNTAHNSQTTTLSDVVDSNQSFSKQNPGLPQINLKHLQSNTQSDACQQKSKHDNAEEMEVESRDTYKVILQKILGDDLFEKLSVFAESEFKLHYNQSSRTNKQEETCENGINSETFAIGVFSSKETRTQIHSHIKYLFPHLCTKVQKPSGAEEGLNITVQSDTVYWNFHKLLAADEVDDFIRFVDAKDSSKEFSLSCSTGKEERTLIHRLIAKQFGAFLETKTFASGASDDKQIVVRFRQKFQQRGEGGRGQKRKAADQESVVTGFVLRKENLEMLDSINRLASALRIHPSDFSYAGIKDKKAITTQVMSVKGVSPQKMKACLVEREVTGIQISNIQPLQAPLQLGQLKGNYFEIVIRNVTLKQPTDAVEMLAKVEDEVDKAVKNMMANMFLNYFGQQRFGSSSDVQGNAANIGLLILKGDHVAAVKSLLTPIPGKEDPTNKAKRLFLENQDAKSALKMMPNFKSRECMLLKALHRHGMDQEGCTKALLNIPYAMRQLYVHSYCSLVWNKMVSTRMKLFGAQLMVGDLILPEGTSRMSTRDQVQVVTEDDIKTSAFTLQDLALPLPGNIIQYPKNKLGQLYEDYLDKDGLSKSSFRINSLKINIPGDYRKVFARPNNLEFNVWHDDIPYCSEQSIVQVGDSESAPSRTITHSNDTSNPTEDREMVHNSASSTCNNQVECAGGTEGRNCSSQSQVDVKLTFSLPASSYATMCVRELMKE